MTVSTIDSLKIVDVYDHGVPNMERIAIYVNEACDLSEYCLLLGIPGGGGGATPIRDHMLWFGHAYVQKGDWIMVYTASGTTMYTPLADGEGATTSKRMISIHWGKEMTIFQNRAVTPMLIKIGAVGIPAQPQPQFQGIANPQNRLWGKP